VATATATSASTSGGMLATNIALNGSTSSKSLAPGAIAGIAVGGAVALIAFLVTIILCCRKRKNAKHNSLDSAPKPPPSHDAEKPGWEFVNRAIPSPPKTVEVPLAFVPDTPRTLVSTPSIDTRSNETLRNKKSYESLHNKRSFESFSRPPKSPKHQLIQSFPLPADTTPPPTSHSSHSLPTQSLPVQLQNIQPAPVATFTRSNSKRGVDDPFQLPPITPTPAITPITRSNSKRGVDNPFPIDWQTRKPIVPRVSDDPLPEAFESDVDTPQDSEESALTQITPTKVSKVQVEGMQRKPSIKTLPLKFPQRKGILTNRYEGAVGRGDGGDTTS
jgi:hypothetical protein